MYHLLDLESEAADKKARLWFYTLPAHLQENCLKMLRVKAKGDRGLIVDGLWIEYKRKTLSPKQCSLIWKLINEA